MLQYCEARVLLVGKLDDWATQQAALPFSLRCIALPLAHCFERARIQCSALMGGRVHLYFTEALATFMDDLKRARPTVLVSVPRLWSKFQQGVFTRLPAVQLDTLLDNPATAATVAKQVLASLGLDAVKRAGTGSAPMPPALIGWYSRLGLPLYDSDAMTEDFAFPHTSSVEAHAPGRVGRPNPGVQTRIANDGEILVKSPGRMVGYFKALELTAECFTEDGFFRTGDLGRYDQHGPGTHRRPLAGPPDGGNGHGVRLRPASSARHGHAGRKPAAPSGRRRRAGPGGKRTGHFAGPTQRRADTNDEDQAQPHRSQRGGCGGDLVQGAGPGGLGLSATLVRPWCDREVVQPLLSSR